MTEQQNINIMITNVSVINKYSINEYTDVSGEHSDITGYITNEPPIKYLMEKLNEDGGKLDKLILIASDDVNRKVTIKLQRDGGNKEEVEKFEADYGNGKMTSVEILKDKIIKFSDEKNIPCPEFEVVKLSDGGNGGTFSEISDTAVVNAVDEVNQKLIEESHKCCNLNVYIESNGGVRYVIVMLLSVMNILQKVYANIKLQGVYSMIYNKKTDDQKIPILDTSMTYASIELLSAMNEFIYYGRAKALADYFDKRFTKRKETDEKYDEDIFEGIKKCINQLQKIADDMQLCRTEQMIDNFYENESIKDVLMGFKAKYKEDEDPDARIFISVIDNIMKEYSDIYDNPNPNKFLNLPKIIKWCIDKDYIQQALTLCSEKLPQYFVQSHMIHISEEWKEYARSLKTGMNKNYEENYYFLCQFANREYKEFISYIKLHELLKVYSEESTENNQVKVKKLIDKFNKVFLGKSKNVPFLECLEKYFHMELCENPLKEQCLRNFSANFEKLINAVEKDEKNKKEVNKWINKFNFEKYNEKEYNIKNRFANKLRQKLDFKFTPNYRKNISNYNYFGIFDDTHFYAVNREKFNEISVIYGTLKEQRNLSNHAAEKSQKEDDTLSMNQIKSLITWELEKIEEYNRINGEVKDVH